MVESSGHYPNRICLVFWKMAFNCTVGKILINSLYFFYKTWCYTGSNLVKPMMGILLLPVLWRVLEEDLMILYMRLLEVIASSKFAFLFAFSNDCSNDCQKLRVSVYLYFTSWYQGASIPSPSMMTV